MIKTHFDCIIIGGGPAGLAAALQLHKKGSTDILVLEREHHLGGILRQCIHDGFGLTRFKESLSGPEYAQRFIEEVKRANIPVMTDTTVLDITSDKTVTAVTNGKYYTFTANAIVLTTGCRERTRGALAIPGSRPAGVYTAGVAQSYINLYNTMVGKNVVILGSGDIGLIMARRLTLEGAKVLGVYEIQDHPSGLNRNVIQCLEDYDIPLHLSQTVTEIHGKSRLKGVTVAKVDENKIPIEGTEKYIETDTLVLSVGLIPENELSLMADIELDPRTNGPIVNEMYSTSTPGIFAAGNSLHVHDLVDFVSLEAESLANSVDAYLSEGTEEKETVNIKTCESIIYTVPQKITADNDFTLYFRSRVPMKNASLTIKQGSKTILSQTIKHLIPAEMERVRIKSSLLTNSDSLEVMIND